MKCQNKWYSPLPSGITLIKDCKKQAVTELNGVMMCQSCFNKRSKLLT